MSKPDLVYVFDTSSVEASLLFEIDRNTNELYYNKKKILTDMKLDKTERYLAWAITFSTGIIALCNIIDLFLKF